MSETKESAVHHGGCGCGAVSFEVVGELAGPDACHCTACRKWTGHYLVSTDVKRSALSVTGADMVTWHQSSEKIRRGFCSICGASLFFDPFDQIKHDWIAVSMGAFAQPTGTTVKVHIFVADKGDYYEITDGLPPE